MEEMIGVHVIVKGKVQGVGFRAFTESQANQKGLLGWVRNRQDGTVEVEAEGARSALEAFLEILEKGPLFSHVTEMIVDWKDTNWQNKGFTIRPS